MAKEEVPVKKEKRPSALKRDLQSKRRRMKNRVFKSKVKTASRELAESISKLDQALNQENLTQIYSLMDKGVKLGVFKRNKASRVKARMHAKLTATPSKK